MAFGARPGREGRFVLLLAERAGGAREAIRRACAARAHLLAPPPLHIALLPAHSAAWVGAGEWEQLAERADGGEGDRRLCVRQVERLLDEVHPGSSVEIVFHTTSFSLAAPELDTEAVSLAVYRAMERCREKGLCCSCTLALHSATDVDKGLLGLADKAETALQSWAALLEASCVWLPSTVSRARQQPFAT